MEKKDFVDDCQETIEQIHVAITEEKEDIKALIVTTLVYGLIVAPICLNIVFIGALHTSLWYIVPIEVFVFATIGMFIKVARWLDVLNH